MTNKQLGYLIIVAVIVASALFYIGYAVPTSGTKRESSTPIPSDSNFSVSKIPNSINTFYLIVDKRTGVEYIFNYTGGGVKVDR